MRTRVAACTMSSERPRARSGCSCSFTAACIAPMTRARAGSTSGVAGSRRISASRSTVDPADPDSAYLIPLVADMDRVTPDGRVRVYETRNAGADWTARGDGLPSRDAYLTVLRQAFSRAAEGERLELYFGATSGELFGSGDAGASWTSVASRLPPVYSVVAV